jgi:hypothetical protein
MLVTGVVGLMVAGCLNSEPAQCDFEWSFEELETSRPAPARFSFLNDYPDYSNLGSVNASHAQGIAYNPDSGHWYFSNKHTVVRLDGNFSNPDQAFHLWEWVEVQDECSSTSFGYERRPFDLGEFAGMGSNVCTHVGGIEYFDGELYVALDHCSHSEARSLIAVFDARLNLRRVAALPEMESFPWLAVNPRDPDNFYTVMKNKAAVDLHNRALVVFPRNFDNGEFLQWTRLVEFDRHPQDLLDHFWTQGGGFSQDGLFFRVVDDAKAHRSRHTGIWVYSPDQPQAATELGTTRMQLVGFVHIPYDAAQIGGRNLELQDLDTSPISCELNERTCGSLHVLLLDNDQPFEEAEIWVKHYQRWDMDA